MIEYTVKLTKQYENDFDKALKRKKEYGTYASNIDEFKKDVRSYIRMLRTSPKSGSNLSA